MIIGLSFAIKDRALKCLKLEIIFFLYWIIEKSSYTKCTFGEGGFFVTIDSKAFVMCLFGIVPGTMVLVSSGWDSPALASRRGNH
jgi:hypothetical protein